MKNTYKVNEEAVKKIAEKVYDNGTTVINRNNLEEMFPTFKESKEREDDRIRKELIDYFSSSHAAGTFRGIPWGRVVAWLEKQGNKDMGISEATKKKLEDNLNKALEKETPESCNEFLEKQGEQKLVEKVEPKFHEGEWITNGDYTWKIVEVKPLDYVLQSQDGNIVDDTISHVDEQFHSFTIEDTKDGDQCEQKPFGQRKECEDCQFNYAGECKGYCALKRNEQKPADKVEPRFKVGDWVVIDGEVLHVKEVTKDGYLTDEGGLIPFRNEKEAHIWTIQDAKDGDVLATLDYILVFKEFLKNDGGISYCHYDFGAGNPQFIWLEDKNWYFGKEAIIHPATKEQRDLLFQKMKEAGYEWDAYKKELKKIEQKPAWNEKDKDMVRYIGNAITCEESAKYLEEKGIDMIEAHCWLESFKDRYTWRPTEEQMDALDRAQAELCSTEYNKPICDLINSLNKLREE